MLNYPNNGPAGGNIVGKVIGIIELSEGGSRELLDLLLTLVLSPGRVCNQIISGLEQ